MIICPFCGATLPTGSFRRQFCSSTFAAEPIPNARGAAGARAISHVDGRAVTGLPARAYSLPDFMHAGFADPPAATPDYPLYTFQQNRTGATIQTIDPGLDLTTGKFANLSKVQVPVLRGLSDRGPYMHNGVFGNLGQVVGFYNKRFNIDFTPQEQTDLVNFPQAL